jgi:hypothetical protein
MMSLSQRGGLDGLGLGRKKIDPVRENDFCGKACRDI